MLSPIVLSLQITLAATMGIFVIGLALALFLVRSNARAKILLELFINLPLVLPPSVVGYYLLITLGRDSIIAQSLNLQILFTPTAAIIAAMIVALPLMVQSAQAAIANVDPALENAARTLGLTEWQVIARVTLPLARRGIFAGLVLGSARALGEFGATLMVAGNIPGVTQTAPLAIYDAVQAGRFADANALVFALTLLSLASLILVKQISRERSDSRR